MSSATLISLEGLSRFSGRTDMLSYLISSSYNKNIKYKNQFWQITKNVN